MSSKIRITPRATAVAACILAAACAPSQPGAVSGSAAAPAPAMGLGIDTTGFDRSVRPQDDFYSFVNGSWLKRTEIPADRSTYGTFILLRDQAQASLRTLVEEAASKQNAPGSDEQKVGDLYKSFMDTARIERLGIQPLRADIDRIRAVRSRAEYPALFAQMRRRGTGLPFSFGVGQDQKMSSRYVVGLSQSGLGLPDREYYLDPSERSAGIRREYTNYAQTLLGLAGTPNAAAAAQNVIAFETALATRQWERTRLRDPNAQYNPTAVADLSRRAPGFNWSEFLRSAGVSVDTVILRQPDYFARIDSVLAQTPVETVQNYLVLRMVDNAAPYLSSDFANARFNFRGKVLSGTTQERPRWQRGIDVVEGTLGELAGEMYVERNFSPAAKQRAQELVQNLMAAFNQGIDELEWMSPATRAQAHQKLSSISVKIGYPDTWRDYSALQIDPADLLGNLRRASEFEYQRTITGRIGQPVNRNEWGMTPQTVNAYYNPTNNEIVFPAAILRPPFFDPNADDAVNYGGIGGVIGHEISHGFDDQGRKSDAQGNLRDWWTPEDATAFESRATALANQYSSYSPIEGANVNGRLTLGENIGDLSGLAIAYKAYHNSLNGRPAPVINGFTGDQRFFLGWAQIWRSKFRDQALRQQLLTDPHSPGQYRTNGVLVNFPAFYEAFGVKQGDRMWLPADQRIKLW
ncbi:M13 family metallopeptidase [Longimicrobium terrae]|uniref:Putative metalloendopeptidase n=1 Tax=Longimicrobium terrae TaxID=1639882 RepID=A0A841H5W7_9BACT|nr:M13 family metallopeptidase [Longimicrobium terrae]MBB4639046.1 putative metalloendopeptidase [Longimicrobium terrae]MBB6073353.1 putative metalloendopeptidase [Longimicrobium terrae]NNC28791.1 M13 family metallopeptidase [Longimicrobium terrae]